MGLKVLEYLQIQKVLRCMLEEMVFIIEKRLAEVILVKLRYINKFDLDKSIQNKISIL